MLTTNSSNVSVYITVRNESQRIESCLKTFSWADEIFVFDKDSDDNTADIARNIATQVIKIPNSNKKIGDKYFSELGSKEWCLFITASDLMHPELVGQVLACTMDDEFKYDVIGLPYRHYNFGLYSKHNPFDSEFKYILIRRSCVVLNKVIHREIAYKSSKIYRLSPLSKAAALYHLSNVTALSYIEKLHRYIDIETSQGHSVDSRGAFLSTLKAFAVVVIKKRTLFYGRDGFALFAAYFSYYLLKYLALWDRDRLECGKGGKKVYEQIEKDILELVVNKK